jgi:hypothetical protein
MRRTVYTKKKHKKVAKTKKPGTQPMLYCPCCSKERTASQARTLLSLEKKYNENYQDPYSGPPPEGWILKVAGNKDRKLAWACDVCLSEGRAIRAEPWRQLTGLMYPFFAYIDQSLPCEDCGKDFKFSAQEQRYWYDVLQFQIDSYPKQCAPCRRKRRIYKRHFHDLQRAIEALDSNSSEQLAHVAEGFLKIGSPQKALEFFRRARNKARKQSDKDQFQQRIVSIQAELEAGPHGSANP